MKKLILIFLFVSLFSHLAKAQQPSPLKFTAIKFSPLDLLNFGNSSFDVKVEYKTRFPVSGQLSYGIGIPYDLGGSRRIKDQFHKIKFELRSYFPSDYYQKRYLAIEGVFIPRRYEIENSFYRRGNTAFDFDRADVVSSKWALHLKLGSQKNWNGKLLTDLFIGIGLRRLKNEFSPDEVTIRSSGFFFFFDDFSFFGSNTREDGTSVFPSLTFGINIGFYAGKRKND